ncbi:MAG TPA: DUF1206 domain-containing protein [Thermoanaerobaculia bacterium]|jgi:hypothetical protein|nr:DUF1206 domain-containing protein [Thermoanaerobaculia bacterium]
MSAKTPPAARPWIERLARLGYAAKGVVYLLLGWLAASAARGIGDVPSGSREVFSVVLAKPLGRAMLAAIALGLAGYVLWRVVAAIADAQGKGSDPKGLAVRGYYLGSAAVHTALVVAALRLLVGHGAAGGGDRTPTQTAKLMAQPFGRWLVGIVGLLVLVAAARQVQLALGKYRKKVRVDRVPARARPWVGPIVGFGLIARAVVFTIIGGFLLRAALHRDPHEAKGLAGALRTVEAQPAGVWLLGVLAAGLAAYGVFQLLEARYRTIRP